MFVSRASSLALVIGLATYSSSTNAAILITGANRGIGRAMSSALASEGHQVIMSCRNPHLCKAAVDEVREETGGDIEMLILDVTKEDSIASALNTVMENYLDEIDVLVNNAGIFIERYENRSEWTEEDFNATLSTNFKGAVHVTVALAPYLAQNSSVLMVSSGFSRRRFLVDPFYLDCLNSTTLTELWSGCKVFKPESAMANETGPAYKISKVMLNRGVELLAEDPLLVQRGILINAGNPGTTDTRMAPGADKTVEEGAESLNWLVRLSLEGGLDFTSKHFDQDKEALEW